MCNRDMVKISGGATHKGQNFKKLIYSMFIIYILKNVACKN